MARILHTYFDKMIESKQENHRPTRVTFKLTAPFKVIVWAVIFESIHKKHKYVIDLIFKLNIIKLK